MEFPRSHIIFLGERPDRVVGFTLKGRAVVVMVAGLATMVAGCAAPGRMSTEIPRRPVDAREANARGLRAADAGDLATAEQAFRDALRADPTFAAAHNNLGLCLLLAPRPALYEAAVEFTQAAKLAKHSPEPLVNLGRIFELSGQDGAAIDAYERALAREATNVEAMGRLARLSVRRGPGSDRVDTLLEALAHTEGASPWKEWALMQIAARHEPRDSSDRESVLSPARPPAPRPRGED